MKKFFDLKISNKSIRQEALENSGDIITMVPILLMESAFDI